MTSTSASHTTLRHRLLSHGIAAVAAAVLVSGTAGPAAVAAPTQESRAVAAQAQNVDWMSSDTATYLGSIGMDVMVPSWVPSPFTGVAPDVYAGDGSYSLYWMAPGTPPTFLHITGVVGGALPDGSKADLNIPLSINESVQGWPAIRDIGIPAGSDTPIYDQVWWIVDGVRYSVESNNIGTDSLTIANTMLHLDMPVYVEPTAPPVVVPDPTIPPVVVAPPTEPPYEEPRVPPTSEPVYVAPTDEPVYDAPTSQPVSEPAVNEPVSQAPATEAPRQTTTSTTGGSTGSTATSSTSSTSDSSGTTRSSEPWSPGRMDGNIPSDGTSGPRPPVIGGDGTGGIFDTSLPRIIDVRP